jgi:ribosome-associated translation inhibitor RaiA
LETITSAHMSHASFSRKYVAQKIERFNSKDLNKINSHYHLNIQPINVTMASGHQVIK